MVADFLYLGLQSLQILKGLRLFRGSRSSAAGWNSAIISVPLRSKNWPCSCEILKSGLISSMALMRPRHTMILGFISRTCARR